VESKLIFLDKKIYWVLLVLLLGTLLAHVMLLSRKFDILTLLHILWIVAILFLLFSKHKNALLNIKLWLIVAFVAGPLLRMAGHFLNEILDEFSVAQLDFYLYRFISVLVGLIILNWVRNTVKVESSS